MKTLKYFQPDQDTMDDNSLPATAVWLNYNNCKNQFSKPAIIIEFSNDDIELPVIMDATKLEIKSKEIIKVFLKYSKTGFNSDDYINIEDEYIFAIFDSYGDFLKKDILSNIKKDLMNKKTPEITDELKSIIEYLSYNQPLNKFVFEYIN